MDIQHLVDRLEDLIDEGRHIWLTKLTMVDEERALEIIDQMRISIPEEVDKANRVINQRERIMAQANEEAARVIDIAKEKADALIQRDAITQAAQNRAANIIEQARQSSDVMRGDAETYVIEVLAEFEVAPVEDAQRRAQRYHKAAAGQRSAQRRAAGGSRPGRAGGGSRPCRDDHADAVLPRARIRHPAAAASRYARAG